MESTLCVLMLHEPVIISNNNIKIRIIFDTTKFILKYLNEFILILFADLKINSYICLNKTIKI